MIWFLLFLATAIEVSGTLCLRMSAVTGRRFWVVLVALCYVSASVSYTHPEPTRRLRGSRMPSSD